jgi:P-type Ca2+ transporter type 2C
MAEERPWHALTVEDVFEGLNSSESGLQEAEAASRLEKYGPNEIKTEAGPSKLSILLHQVRNPLIAVLIIAALVALAAGETIDTIVIAVVVVLNTAIGFTQEYRAEKAVQALQSRAAPEAEVLRCPDDGDCDQTSIEAKELVPGDVIVINTGDRIPADARIFEAANLKIDEAMLTGESLSVEKTVDPLDEDLQVAERTNLAFGGTVVTEGRGKAVVFATGDNTQMGEIATLIQETEKAVSPLQEQIMTLGKTLGIIAVSAGALIFIMGVIQDLTFQELFLFVIAVIVSAIPEGLPAVMTVTLSIGVMRMANRHAIIRRLQAVDTLGATTVICTDKTGTLTSNQMTVQQIFVDDKVIKVGGKGFEPQGDFKIDGDNINPREEGSLPLVLKTGALCNDSKLINPEDNENGNDWEIRGDPTEGALIVVACKADLVKDELEKEYPRLDEIPFSSDNKYMVTFNEISEGEVHVYMKGAPEKVLDYCQRVKIDDQEQELDEETREKILETNTGMAADALRVLAVAYRKIGAGDVESEKESIKEGQGSLVFLGLFGMMDPPRSEVEEAVRNCQKAGIQVIMATGDHKITGEAIGRMVGILDGSDDCVFSGSDIDEMDDDELDRIIKKAQVFARVSPEHKTRIVASLQRHGQVVAMTGDGVNDAPALKGAEIGIAMGITGTDVTKETAEMVLTDDNFASIVAAVEEGRVVFKNVQKVVKFLVATNAGEILTILGAMTLLPMTHLIFTPVQILWVNLVTDGLLVIPIALEDKEGDVMDEPPRDRGQKILSRNLLLHLVFVAVIMAVGTNWIFSSALAAGDQDYARTMAFVTIAMYQVFNALNVRSLNRSLFTLGVFTNKYLIGAIFISVVLLVLSTLVPFLQIALSTVPLALNDWGLVVLVSSSVFILVEIRKFIANRFFNK